MASVEIKSRNSKESSKSVRKMAQHIVFETTLKCMYLNATSLENKFDEFTVVVDTNRPKIIGISETWFKSTSVVNMQGYDLYRKDRSDGRRGGGVCLYIENSIDSFELNDGFNLSKIEQVWVVVYSGKDKYLIGCLYRPSDFVDMNDFDLVFKHARNYVDEKGFKDVLIMGDFNFPSISWSNGSVFSIKNDTGIEHRFACSLNDTFLYHHVNIPTFQMSNEEVTSTLDLIFTTESANSYAIETKFVLGNINKGHLVMSFDYCLNNKERISKNQSLKFVYKNAKYDKISHFISNVNWVRLFENKQVQEMYDELIFYSSVASNLFIPIVDASQMKCTANPWINKELKALIRKKKNLRYKNCVRKRKDTNEYKKLCHSVKSEVKRARLLYEQELINKAKHNPKLLYKYMNNQLVAKESIKALRKDDRDLSQDQFEIANILNKCFQDVFVIENNVKLPMEIENNVNTLIQELKIARLVFRIYLQMK